MAGLIRQALYTELRGQRQRKQQRPSPVCSGGANCPVVNGLWRGPLSRTWGWLLRAGWTLADSQQEKGDSNPTAANHKQAWKRPQVSGKIAVLASHTMSTLLTRDIVRSYVCGVQATGSMVVSYTEIRTKSYRLDSDISPISRSIFEMNLISSLGKVTITLGNSYHLY